jgi:molecular chaperone GrpE
MTQDHINDESGLNEVSTEDPIQKLQEEIEEYKNKYLLQLAETENMRKRLMKEKEAMVQFSVENIILEMLLPIDNFENALKCAGSATPEIRHWALGFEMILAQLREVLTNHGVSMVASVGSTFDPFCHEAVEVEETEDQPEGLIIEEYVKGYRCGNRTVRPAKVKVTKRPQPEQQELKGE